MSALLIQNLLERRGVLRSELDDVLKAPTDAKRSLTTDEEAKFAEYEAEIREIDERVKTLNDQALRDAQADEIARQFVPRAHITSEPAVYRSGPRGQSYFKDLHLATRKGDRDAAERLERNSRQVADARAKADGGAEQRAISTGMGGGGELVPPLWLETEFIKYVRPGRTTANLCRQGEVPPGTDVITLPKINSGTAAAPQVNQNTGIVQQDLTTSSISSPVVTIAGGQTISLQLLQQSPLNIDDVVLQDLAEDYAMKYDLQVLSGTGTNGQVTGLLTLAGTTTVTWTSATPAVAGPNSLFTKIASAIQGIHTSRFLSPNAIIMHPRRWWWIVSAVDTANRPLVVPNAMNPMNALAVFDDNVAQGLAGSILGLPVYLDPLLPTTLGAGTNQDEVIVAKMDDLWSWEGNVRAETFEQTYAGQLSVLCRLYNYASFQAGRYPQSIATISGTGLIAPTF
ncbi:phage major capsid protein [Kitasatospora sp. GP82]|uniref:phage major capsid protein n=1 Tax=Kitasatospora sp. GP82 TaxID=3035089 RepID=UPI0024760CFC|nr:phage major capsid protein [Kitasatospora sp. GP82]MDH6123437.1 HK97 family phage major capsid protein [Kitasatospora sp. GP82]